MPRTVAHEPAGRPSGRRVAAAVVGATALLLLALAVVAPRAEATFGADLRRPANNQVPCTINPALGIPWVGASIGSCTWLLTGNAAAPGLETANVPAGAGVLTSAEVKVGPVTGPMQFVVVRFLRAADPDPRGSLACCTVRFVSETFTPRANAITRIPFPDGVPVVNDRVPTPPGSDALRFDALAISVLAPDVPLPAHRTGNSGDGLLGFYPALLRGEERFGQPAGIGGFVPLIRGQWSPIASGPRGGGGGPGGGDPGDAGDAGDSGGSGTGRVTLSAGQLRINQRIAQAAVRRVNALEARFEGRPAPPTTRSGPGGRVTLSAAQLRINQRISQAAVRRVNALEARVEGRTPPPTTRRKPAGRVTLSAAQLRINQRISQAAVRRVNALEPRIP